MKGAILTVLSAFAIMAESSAENSERLLEAEHVVRPPAAVPVAKQQLVDFLLRGVCRARVDVLRVVECDPST